MIFAMILLSISVVIGRLIADLAHIRCNSQLVGFTLANCMVNVSMDSFIFITGFATDPQIRTFLIEQEVKFLVKPFPINGLISCVKELLG